MNRHSRSLAVSMLSFALTVLVACWAINRAVQFLLAVWPVVLTVMLFSAALPLLWRYFHSRDYW